MSVFTFEIIPTNAAPVIADVLKLSDERMIWCHVEALALCIQNSNGIFIQVKNSTDETLVRAGIASAVASIEKCSYADCPLKRELECRISAERHIHLSRRDGHLQISIGPNIGARFTSPNSLRSASAFCSNRRICLRTASDLSSTTSLKSGSF
jgi:hypothetical protein